MILHTPIFLRSPRHVKVSGTAGQETKVELYLFNSPSSVPATPTKTLSKPIPSTLITENTYDISTIARGFISFNSPIEWSTILETPSNHYCYCYVKVYLDGVLEDNLSGFTYKHICFDGYGWHSDGANPTPPLSLMTEGTYYTEENNGAGNLTVWNPDTSLNDMSIQWSHPSGSPTYSSLLTNEMNDMPNVHPSLVSVGADVDIIQDGVTISQYKFTPTCEPKHTPIKCDFVNANGAWQRIVFFKASKSKMTVKSNEFNMMSSSVDYDVSENRTQSFNINGNESITVNTGWVVESYSMVIAELMHSEHIKLNGRPVALATKSIDLQESINSKNINYKLEFKYAHSTLNYNS